MNLRNYKGALLLAGGIMIGVALTAITFHVTDPKDSGAKNHTLVAATPAQEPHHAVQHQHSGAAYAQTHAHAPQHAPDQAAESPHDWLKPEDVTAHSTAKNGTANGAAAKKEEAKYQSSHTTYYVYGGAPGADMTHAAMPAAHGAMPPTELTSTVSGYPIPIGSGPKAVDYPMAGGTFVGDNGMAQNPCVDPPSVTRSRAYRQVMKH